MLFHVSYRDIGNTRFVTRGALPPKGATMLSRWHSGAGNRGFIIAETDDPDALASWLKGYTDYFEVTPVMRDEGATGEKR